MHPSPPPALLPRPATLATHLRVLRLLVLLALPLASRAHGYWFDIKENGRVGEPVRVQICFGEIDEHSVRHREMGPELPQMGGFRVYVLAENGQRTDLTLAARRDCWETTFTPRHRGTYRLLGLHEGLPVVDRSATGGPSVRPIEYLCAAYAVGSGGAAAPLPRQLLDIMAATQGELISVRVFRAGQSVASGTKLRVFNPENWEKSLTADAQGAATFQPTMPGLYIIRQDWVDPKPGSYQSVAYVSVRHRCDYCLWVR